MEEWLVFTLFYVAWTVTHWRFFFGDKGMAFFGNGVFFYVYQSVGNQRFSG
jgi:hypothetical protein